MLDSPQLPSVVDLSFDYNGSRTRFNIVEFANVSTIIISDIEKIGQIVHVSYIFQLKVIFAKSAIFFLFLCEYEGTRSILSMRTVLRMA